MHVQQKHKQLSWIGGLFCLIILVIGIVMLIFDNNIGTKDDEFRRESVAYVTAFLFSWFINIGTIVFIEPLLHKYSTHRSPRLFRFPLLRAVPLTICSTSLFLILNLPLCGMVC